MSRAKIKTLFLFIISPELMQLLKNLVFIVFFFFFEFIDIVTIQFLS